MAKKSRTPPPPRPVQAPKRRVERRRDGRGRLVYAVLGAIAVAAVAAVGIALAVRGGGTSGDAAAGCTTRHFPQQSRAHVARAAKGFTYNSFPPTSGPHHPIPAIWGVYEEPIPELTLIHNLEHGGIVVQYGDQVPQKTVNAILQWYNSDPKGVIVAPLPRLSTIQAKPPADAERKVYVTAWQNLMTCQGFDAGAFSSFRKGHRYNGPEKFPPTYYLPGNGA